MNRSGWPQLRVVWDKGAKPRTNRKYQVPVQFSFPLDRNENRIAFIGDTILTGSLLMELLRTIQPHYLLDLRICPRFDILGYSRKRAFSDFERWGAKYFCLSPGDESAEMSDRVQTIITKISRDLTGPMIVLVEAEDTVEQLSRALPKPKVRGKAKTTKGEWEFTVAGIPNNTVPNGS